ncbi:MAG: queuosine precursor transporter [Oliverpabstia sp.]|nr:queuosine precursor transporter [Oliverpabstia sp.]
MPNELLLIFSLLLLFGGVLFFYYLFGSTGLYCWTVFATIAANIEVLIVVNAFGMEQTLGNVMFASTFLVTDILSEIAGKKEANRAVRLGIFTSVFFILVSQLWLQFTPAKTDFIMPSIEAVFSNTPRLMLASFLVYAICQQFDVWAYHKWWEFTTKKCGDSSRFLWVRNNGSTLISQFLNTLLFTLGAFWGIHDTPTLISIIASSYVIFIITSLLDTPFIYLARKIRPRNI